ncbi:MAG: succinylglutamate desuccinylase [Spirochaetes bacterium RIFOXYC1_FULL_54_7]|nr:MAG: succinylglutamate desuccinylase [Spirochaetes bacterium RIFOXYC1_FULL_54_7]
MKKHHITALIVSVVALLMAVTAGKAFLEHRRPEAIVRGPGVTGIRKLSSWFPTLAGSPGDTDVYIFQGEESGGSMLIIGGTHPNEPSSFLSAVLLIENAVVNAGTLYVIPRANSSGFTHNDPQEGAPMGYSLTLSDGSSRYFRYGSRATNPVHQWPDPDVYIHATSGQTLSGNETRNLNRGYPGRPDGTLTERVCYGITELIRTEKVDISIDLHEASPEYPVINAIVAHERAMTVASYVVLGLEMYDINIGLEPSPKNLRGLTHRELGDATDTLAVLMETANPSQGRLRSRTGEALVLTGKDPYYVKAQALGRLYVPFDETGHPIEQRVGRHLTAIGEFAFALSMEYPDKPLEIDGIPGYDELLESGVGAFLLPVQ